MATGTTKIEASKERAKEALQALSDGETATVKEFLEAAIKRLPSEKAIEADKQRKKDERKAAKTKPAV